MTDMVRLDGGTFRMGSDRFYPEEGPAHDATVAPFEIDRYAVTNDQFAAFITATGHVTVAERPLDPAAFPGAELDSVEPGSLVFTPTSGPVDLGRWQQWWHWVPGANWRHPYGPGSDLHGRGDHPVIQIAYPDAVAYADWTGRRLPTEAEWEFAARGGLAGATFAWGEEPNDGTRANTWQGRFPYRNESARGWVYTAPVGSFPPNGYGLHEMTGNTWEWTASPWLAGHQAGGCDCTPDNGAAAARRVLKGGSHLCAPEYCFRYRPAARSPQTEDSATTHIGFRCARSLA